MPVAFPDVILGQELYHGGALLEIQELARDIMEAIVERGGERIILLDLRALSPIADYFVISSAESGRQMNATVDAVRECLQKNDQRLLNIEGLAESGWIILDSGSIIVHIFTPAERGYYNLEEFWKAAPLVVSLH